MSGAHRSKLPFFGVLIDCIDAQCIGLSFVQREFAQLNLCISGAAFTCHRSWTRIRSYVQIVKRFGCKSKPAMGNCFPSKEERPKETTRKSLLTTESDEYTKDLIEACSCGDAMLVAELLSNGANPSAIDPDTNGTALMIAATVGQAYCLSLLIDAGALVDQKHPDFGMTALLWACNNAHVRCVELLIEAGADKHATEIAGACAL